jgi:hypothetical protein
MTLNMLIKYIRIKLLFMKNTVWTESYFCILVLRTFIMSR